MSWRDSGQSYLVARFECARDATAFVDRLRVDLGLDTQEPKTLDDLFAREGLRGPRVQSLPEHLVAVGRNVLGWTLEGAVEDDPFPSFRALAWTRGARVVANGACERWPAQLVTALRIDASGEKIADISRLAAELGEHTIHGDVLFAASDPRARGLTALVESWDALARRCRGALAAELVPSVDGAPPPLGRALERAPEPAPAEWLVAATEARDPLDVFGDILAPGSYECAAGAVIARHPRVRAEDGAALSKLSHAATVIESDTLVLQVTFHPPRPELRPPPAFERLRAALAAHLGTEAVIEERSQEDDELTCAIRTRSPTTALGCLSRFAHAQDLDAWVRPRAARPLEPALRRLALDVGTRNALRA